VATTTKTPERTKPGTISEQLEEIDRAISYASNLADEFQIGLKDDLDWERNEQWQLIGFTEEALLELKSMMRDVLAIRAKVLGGMSDEDEHLLRGIAPMSG
jgi:hypothetical protein